jgi:hypothetical protein
MIAIALTGCNIRTDGAQVLAGLLAAKWALLLITLPASTGQHAADKTLAKLTRRIMMTKFLRSPTLAFTALVLLAIGRTAATSASAHPRSTFERAALWDTL